MMEETRPNENNQQPTRNAGAFIAATLLSLIQFVNPGHEYGVINLSFQKRNSVVSIINFKIELFSFMALLQLYKGQNNKRIHDIMNNIYIKSKEKEQRK